MSACPDCGRWNVPEPCGHVAFCGRRVQYNDQPDDWQTRVALRDRCIAVGRRDEHDEGCDCPSCRGARL
jgi:hypothetical protein